MGFALQLKLLLWKNFTLKRRKPHVLLFELLIPLVLFLIVLIIRRHQPSQRQKELRFPAKPLPSAGLVAVMQSFCDGGYQDEDGFMNFPNSTVYQFLANLNEIAKQKGNVTVKDTFEPRVLESIPNTYRTIIEDPIAIHLSFVRAGQQSLENLLIGRRSADGGGDQLTRYLMTNLNLTSEEVASVYGARLNMANLYNLMFGFEKLLPIGTRLSLPELINQLISHETSFGTVGSVLAWIFNATTSQDLKLNVTEFARDAIDILVTGKHIRLYVCPNDFFETLEPLIKPSGIKTESNAFQTGLKKICSLDDKQLDQLASELSSNIDEVKVERALKLNTDWDRRKAKANVKRFYKEFNDFGVFQKVLKELYEIASLLPNDVCDPSVLGQNIEDDIDDDDYELPFVGKPIKPPSKNCTGNDCKRQNNVEGLARVWLKMEKTICGPKTPPTPRPTGQNETIDKEDEEPIRKFIREQNLVLSMLYGNPTILYSPNKTGSAADRIIKKANETFQLLDQVNHYARSLYDITNKMLNYTNETRTLDNYEKIIEIRSGLLKFPKSFDLFDLEQGYDILKESDSIGGNLTIFKRQLRVINNAACSWLTLTKDISLNVFKGFATEDDLVDYFRNKAYSDNVTVIASVVFDMSPNTSQIPLHTFYRIRQNSSFTGAPTALVRNRFWFPGPRNWGYGYYQFGFVWIQDIIERSIISLHTGKEVTDPGSYLQQMPYPCYMHDQFLFIIEHVMPLCMAISWVYSVSMLVQSIVYEKEQRLKEVMKTMGLNSLVHWLAWFITSFIQMSITATLLTAILKFGKVLTYSNAVIVFLYIEVFVVANICFSFLVSAFFSKAKVAAACAGIIYFLTYVPYMYLAVREEVAHDKIPFWAKSLASLFSTTAFGIGAKYFAFYEEVGVGVQWANIAQSPVEDDEYTLWNVMNLMMVDGLLYSTLVWYIENVHPGTYGLPRPWYFPFTKSYWLGVPTTDDDLCCALPFGGKKVLNDGKKNRSRPPSESINLNDLIYFEAEPVNLMLGVSIQNLVKVYDKGTPAAVNKLSVNLYESQITTFLGHNGAGKTTTMSILTGLFAPTSGEAHIYGLDIKTDMDVIRQSMGICPQHNVLFDELTVEEHLWFYACLKNANGGTVLEQEMQTMVNNLSLPIKRGKSVASLSGGMKRKLSVAIAFIGDSKIVILDEPTAGVDPYTRRAIWDLILKYKKERTILLSTHHMDEADVLSDRIAILSNGQIKCCGSPLFLKHNLSEGYHLILVKGHMNPVPLTDNQEEIPAEEVQRFIHQYTPTARFVLESRHEVHFILPNIELKNFHRLFSALECPPNLFRLNISAFGLKNSTLEEIFLRVASNWKMNASNLIAGRSVGDQITSGPSCSSQTDYLFDSRFNREWIKMPTEKIDSDRKLLLNQFSAIVFKRWCCTKRNWKGLFSQIILPAFFVSVAMSVALIAPKIQDSPPIVLSPSQYYNYTQNLGGNVIVFAERSTNQSAILSPTFNLPSGVGATCLLKEDARFRNGSDDLELIANQLKLDSRCTSVLVPGIKPRIFLPTAPTVKVLVTSIDKDFPIIDHLPFNSSPTVPSDQTRFYPNCRCSIDGTGYICDSTGFRLPASNRLLTGDLLLDITGVVDGTDEHYYYLHTTDMYRLRRYGGFTFGLTRPDVPVNYGQNLASKPSKILNQVAVRNVSKIWFNNKGYHSAPTYINAINNAILRANLPPTKGNHPASFGITVINHPMADTNFMLSEEQILRGTDVLIAIFIIVAMSFVPASFVLFLVYERYTKAKHLQFVSGVNVVVYWTANYFWDMCSYVVPATCCILILLIFDIPAYTSKNNLPAVVSLFLMYGWSITPVMYPVSFKFKEPSTAYIFLIVANLFVGITCIVSSFLLEAFLFISYSPILSHIHKILKVILLMFPNYCLGRGLMDIAFNEYQNLYLFKMGQYSKMRSPFAWDLVTRNLIAMALSGFAFFILTILLEFRFFKSRSKNPNNYRVDTPLDEDCDVAEERRRVNTSSLTQDTVLRLFNLSKVFKKPQRHLAVNKLCLDIGRGECFGLLGVNGAGKSTTFKMLTGDLTVTSGDAIVNGHSVVGDLIKARQNVGYCPQFDALFDELTPKEHLKFYARLRGVKDEDRAIESALTRVELRKFADKLVRTLSGGTKRKLSAAIALISSPPIVFMDEPTTGMDPYTRRFLWDLVLDLVHNDNISVVLTSHSMEECEALCSRVGILINGHFNCLGSIQHLKNRFGDGYHIIVRCDADKSTSDIVDWFAKNLPGAVLKENNFNILQYEISSNSTRSHVSRSNDTSISSSTGCETTDRFSLADVFRKLQSSGIAEYTVCQNTLDNLFVNLAKKQQGSGLIVSPNKRSKRSPKKPKTSVQDERTDEELSVRERLDESSIRTGSHISLTDFGAATSSSSSAVITTQS